MALTILPAAITCATSCRVAPVKMPNRRSVTGQCHCCGQGERDRVEQHAGRAEQHHGRHGHGGLFVVAAQHRRHGDGRGGAADRAAGADSRAPRAGSARTARRPAVPTSRVATSMSKGTTTPETPSAAIALERQAQPVQGHTDTQHMMARQLHARRQRRQPVTRHGVGSHHAGTHGMGQRAQAVARDGGWSASTMASHAMPPGAAKSGTRVRPGRRCIVGTRGGQAGGHGGLRFMDGRCPERSGPQSICETGNIVMINLN